MKSPEQKQFEKNVRKRDNYKCICCGSKDRTRVVRIRHAREYPLIKYHTENGATLCFSCSKSMSECDYEIFLINLIHRDNIMLADEALKREG